MRGGRVDKGAVLPVYAGGLLADMATPKILVVDDEPMVIKLVSRILESQGYEVVEAIGSREALEATSGGIDLILSDVMMPEMNGLDLVREVRNRDPATAAVLMSGYSTEDLPADIPLVKKPFTPQGLVAAVERALRQSDETREALRRAREKKSARGELAGAVEDTLQQPKRNTGREGKRSSRKPRGPQEDLAS
jgi:DNA-binding NtrC family response regulator